MIKNFIANVLFCINSSQYPQSQCRYVPSGSYSTDHGKVNNPVSRPTGKNPVPWDGNPVIKNLNPVIKNSHPVGRNINLAILNPDLRDRNP